MIYIYIICLALSSFFTYNSLAADSTIYQNAFFIPSGAFQQNTTVQDIPVRQPNRQQKANKPSVAKPSLPTAKQPAKPLETTQPESLPTPTEAPSKVVIQKTEPSPKQKTAQIKPQQATPKKQAKYKLDDSPRQTPEIKTAAAPEIPPLEKFRQKNIKEMLDTLPYPNFNLPKFKQIYALYALELRSAYRRGKLPSNYEQEETLAKANSIRRFNVK